MSKKSKKHKHKKGSKDGKAPMPGRLMPPEGISEFEALAATRPKMKTKDYEVEMRRLQGEQVALQHRVTETGAKIMVVIEGRDTAG